MSDSNDEFQDQELWSPSHDHNSDQSPSSQWEDMVRAWLSTLPTGKSLTISDLEAWLTLTRSALPEEFRSLSSSQIFDRVTLIQNSIQDMDGIPQGKFQRTNQWRPIYSWLESLKTGELVKSNEVSDWLSKNPKVRDDLLLRHSRYHLMHYIKKCHIKILKRKEKKEFRLANKVAAVKIQKPVVDKQPVILKCKNLSNYSKDSDLYTVKRNEAFKKYEILVELEKQLSTIFPEQ